MRTARHILLGAWGGYALLWLAFLAMLYWPWPRKEADLGEAMIVIFGFSAGLIVTLALLLVGVVLGWRALRQPAHRTWPNLVLVGLSIFGAAAQAFFAGLFFGLI
jgi:hypothetical protein